MLFSLKTMMLILRRSVEVVLRLTVAGICCYAAWWSFKLARADFLFKQDTEASVRSAIRIVPDASECYLRLAQFDRDHAQDLLTHSLRLDAYNSDTYIELALRHEANGDLARAEEALLQAFSVDHTYLPRWSLANFYFRQDNMPQFWAWARKAAEMPSDDVTPLFELCWRTMPDPEKISSEIINDNPEVLRQYTTWLLSKDQLDHAASVIPRLMHSGEPASDRRLVFAVVNRLAAGDKAEAATTLWHALVKQGWAVADSSLINNSQFGREPLPVVFDWSLPEYSGLHSWPGPSGLEAEFTGSQPEACTVAEQIVSLTPGSYRFSSAYRATNIASNTGLRWQIIDVQSNSTLAESADLSTEQGQASTLDFDVLGGNSLLRLRLAYRRALGTTRISGTLVIASTQISPKPNT